MDACVNLSIFLCFLSRTSILCRFRFRPRVGAAPVQSRRRSHGRGRAHGAARRGAADLAAAARGAPRRQGEPDRSGPPRADATARGVQHREPPRGKRPCMLWVGQVLSVFPIGLYSLACFLNSQIVCSLLYVLMCFPIVFDIFYDVFVPAASGRPYFVLYTRVL